MMPSGEDGLRLELLDVSQRLLDQGLNRGVVEHARRLVERRARRGVREDRGAKVDLALERGDDTLRSDERLADRRVARLTSADRGVHRREGRSAVRDE